MDFVPNGSCCFNDGFDAYSYFLILYFSAKTLAICMSTY